MREISRRKGGCGESPLFIICLKRVMSDTRPKGPPRPFTDIVTVTREFTSEEAHFGLNPGSLYSRPFDEESIPIGETCGSGAIVQTRA